MSQEEAPESPTPLAPPASEIARAYADLAMDLHRRIPALEARMTSHGARLDEVHGVALASHGLVSRLTIRVEEIALRVGAKRSLSSGSFAAYRGGVTGAANDQGPSSIPSPQSLEIRTTTTKTGRHMIIDADELDRLKAKFAEKDAEERGAKEALAQLRLEEGHRESLAESRRKTVAFWLLLATAVCSAGAWALGHFTVTPAPSAPQAGGSTLVAPAASQAR